MSVSKLETHQQQKKAIPALVAGENNSVFANLAATLVEIRKLKGVPGYVLRSNAAAVVDLTQKESLTECAVLAWEIHGCSRELGKQFRLADVESTVVEGKTSKLLCMSIGENRLAVFMEKSCAHTWIVKRILI